MFVLIIIILGALIGYVGSIMVEAYSEEKDNKKRSEHITYLRNMSDKFPDAYQALCGSPEKLYSLSLSELGQLAKIDFYQFRNKQREILEERHRKAIEEEQAKQEAERKKKEKKERDAIISAWRKQYPDAIEELVGRVSPLSEHQKVTLLGFTESYLKTKQEHIMESRTAYAAILCRKYPNATSYYLGINKDLTPDKVAMLLKYSDSSLKAKEDEITARQEKIRKEEIARNRASEARSWAIRYPGAVKKFLGLRAWSADFTPEQVDKLLSESESWMKETEAAIVAERERIKAERAQRDREINSRLDIIKEKYPNGFEHVKLLRSEKARAQEIYLNEEWPRIERGNNLKKNNASLISIPDSVYEKYEIIALKYNALQTFLSAQQDFFNRIKNSRAKRYEGWTKSIYTRQIQVIDSLGEYQDHDLQIPHLYYRSNNSWPAEQQTCFCFVNTYCDNIVDIITSLSLKCAVVINDSPMILRSSSTVAIGLQYMKDKLASEEIRCIDICNLDSAKNGSEELLIIFEQVTSDELLEKNCSRVRAAFGNVPLVYISLYRELNEADLHELRRKEEMSRIREQKRKEKEEREAAARMEEERRRREAEEKARREREAEERARKEREAAVRREEERRRKEAEERARREWEERERLKRIAEEQWRREREEQQRKQAINEYLRENGIIYFYHFTDRRNLASIRQRGGLYSWEDCRKKGIDIPYAGGNETSRSLDRRYGLGEYVRLSFCDDHPMAHGLKLQGRDQVLLKVKIDVAELESTLFSDINATDNNCAFGPGLQYLRRVDMTAVKQHFVKKDSPDFKKHQAEVLVKHFVPLDMIINIDHPDTLRSK